MNRLFVALFFCGCAVLCNMQAVQAQYEVTVSPRDKDLDQAPQFDSIIQYVTNHLVYPEGFDNGKFSGYVVIDFMVDTKGEAKDYIVNTSEVSAGDKQKLEEACLRLFKDMPRWEAGWKDGKKVPCKMQLILRFSTPEGFSLEGTPGVIDSNKVYELIELDVFAGFENYAEYISANVIYPDEALRKNIEGMVVVALIVEKNGEISEMKVMKGLGGGCTEEALRVLKGTFGKWTPAMINGKPVRSKTNVVVNFELSGKKKKKRKK